MRRRADSFSRGRAPTLPLLRETPSKVCSTVQRWGGFSRDRAPSRPPGRPSPLRSLHHLFDDDACRNAAFCSACRAPAGGASSTSLHQVPRGAWRHHASRDGVLAAGVASSDADVVDVATGGVDGDVCGPAPLRCATRTRHARTFHATPKNGDDTPTVSDETDHETPRRHDVRPRRTLITDDDTAPRDDTTTRRHQDARQEEPRDAQTKRTPPRRAQRRRHTPHRPQHAPTTTTPNTPAHARAARPAASKRTPTRTTRRHPHGEPPGRPRAARPAGRTQPASLLYAATQPD